MEGAVTAKDGIRRTAALARDAVPRCVALRRATPSATLVHAIIATKDHIWTHGLVDGSVRRNAPVRRRIEVR